MVYCFLLRRGEVVFGKRLRVFEFSTRDLLVNNSK